MSKLNKALTANESQYPPSIQRFKIQEGQSSRGKILKIVLSYEKGFYVVDSRHGGLIPCKVEGDVLSFKHESGWIYELDYSYFEKETPEPETEQAGIERLAELLKGSVISNGVFFQDSSPEKESIELYVSGDYLSILGNSEIELDKTLCNALGDALKHFAKTGKLGAQKTD